MHDIGAPVAYLVLRDGTPVYDRDTHRVGTVAHVLADEDVDIFHGLIIRSDGGPGRYRYADRDQVGAIHERGVLLGVPADQLPEPTAPETEAAAYDGVTVTESPVEARLRRAWDWVSRQR